MGAVISERGATVGESKGSERCQAEFIFFPFPPAPSQELRWLCWQLNETFDSVLGVNSEGSPLL